MSLTRPVATYETSAIRMSGSRVMSPQSSTMIVKDPAIVQDPAPSSARTFRDHGNDLRCHNGHLKIASSPQRPRQVAGCAQGCARVNADTPSRNAASAVVLPSMRQFW
jgi:hypothetical protein